MNCPKCLTFPIKEYVSFLAPVYETTICWNCGSIFYELKDQAKLDEIKGAMVQNVNKKLDLEKIVGQVDKAIKDAR